MQTAAQTMQKSPKFKKIEDIIKPDATMRLHQRLFDRRRKHHIEVREDAGPGSSLSAYLISPKFRRTHKAKVQQNTELVTTTPAPVVQYSRITRQLPEEEYLESQPGHTRSLSDRIAQRYQVFVSQHKPFYYSLTSGTASGWLASPRARVALAGSTLALLLFFTGKPSTPGSGPDNPTGKNPIVVQDTSEGTSTDPTKQPDPVRSTNTQSPPPTATSAPANLPQPVALPPQAQAIPAINIPAYSGGYGSGPAAPTSPSPPTSQTGTPTPSTSLIQDVIKPTPITIPGQDIKIDDKQILKTTDATITIN